MRPFDYQRSNGFTLMELLIAVAIVGVLTTIAYPSYQAYIEETERAIAINEISLIDGKITAIVFCMID